MHFIPVNTPSLNGNEKKYLIDCIETGWISSEGPAVKQFEQNVAAYVGRKYAVAVCNGSAALDMAMQAIELQPDDEVIMPSFTIISPAAAVVRQGAKPILIDSDPQTWNMRPEEIEAKITPRTKAICIVHIYGLPVDVQPILDLAKKHNLYVIEDAAEMHGQTYNGKHCGSFGDISTFSFYPNKHITTGEGGMCLTDNPKLAERLQSLRNLCFMPNRRFVHEEIGWNYRMTNLQAALGLAQLEQLDNFIVRKREIGKMYRTLLADCPHIELSLEKTDYADNIYWVFGIILKETCPYNAIEMMQLLAAKNIGCRPFFYPMHLQPVFQKRGWYTDESYPTAERMGERGFYVPSGLGLTDEEIVYVATTFKEIMCSIA